MKINLDDYMVKNASGLDMKETLAKLEQTIQTYWDVEVRGSEEIQTHVMKIFADFPGVKTNCDFLCSEVWRRMNLGPAEFTPLSKKVLGYLHAARDAGILTIEKGKQGGVKLVLKQA